MVQAARAGETIAPETGDRARLFQNNKPAGRGQIHDGQTVFLLFVDERRQVDRITSIQLQLQRTRHEYAGYGACS